MAKIRLNAELNISSEMFQHLISRNMLTATGKITEDFVFYIQECLARDDNRVQNIILPQQICNQRTSSSQIKTEHLPLQESPNPISLFEQPVIEETKELIKEEEAEEEEESVPLNNLQKTMANLYRG